MLQGLISNNFSIRNVLVIARNSYSLTKKPKNFPLSFKPEERIFQKNTPEESLASNTTDTTKIDVDKGFFVQDDMFGDEYRAGNAAELPEDDINSSPFTIHNLDKTTIETINIRLPGREHIPSWKVERSAKRQKYEIPETEEWALNYGTEDLTIPPSTKSHCTGCGAYFQCNNSSLPGFLPLEMFEKVELQSERFPGFQEHMCRRCYLAKKYNFMVAY